MEIPVYLYYGILCSVTIILSIPLYLKSRENKKYLNGIFIIIAALFFLNGYFPRIYIITGCGQYHEKVLIYPYQLYPLGEYTYILNKSESDLLLEHLVNNFVVEKASVTIGKGGIHKGRFLGIDYLFRSGPPPSESLRGKGGIGKRRLTCIPE